MGGAGGMQNAYGPGLQQAQAPVHGQGVGSFGGAGGSGGMYALDGCMYRGDAGGGDGMCKVPGCGMPRFKDPGNGHVHEFCSRTCARVFAHNVQALGGNLNPGAAAFTPGQPWGGTGLDAAAGGAAWPPAGPPSNGVGSRMPLGSPSTMGGSFGAAGGYGTAPMPSAVINLTGAGSSGKKGRRNRKRKKDGQSSSSSSSGMFRGTFQVESRATIRKIVPLFP